jgi:thiosulfate dehydrogenase [quinone] large subunit
MTMNVIHRQHHITTEGVTTSETEEVSRVGLSRSLAALRIAFGLTFLWAFLDKTFALGFSTGAQFAEDGSRAGTDFMAQDAAWLNGGSPTEGFLTFGVPADNPFHGFFTSLAGQTWVDWLFMAGLLGVGVTLLLGVGMRIGTAAGALMYAFMYAASLPLANNPVVDDHLIGVISMAVLVFGAAGTTWGLGRWWNRTGLVRKYPVLR